MYVGIQERMKLVPVEPTKEMTKAAWDDLGDTYQRSTKNLADAYRAMIAASPNMTVQTLSWENCGELGWCADTIVGRYWVEEVHASFQARLVSLVCENETHTKVTTGKGLEDAKTAAQSDFVSRVLSAIAPV